MSTSLIRSRLRTRFDPITGPQFGASKTNDRVKPARWSTNGRPRWRGRGGGGGGIARDLRCRRNARATEQRRHACVVSWGVWGQPIATAVQKVVVAARASSLTPKISDPAQLLLPPLPLLLPPHACGIPPLDIANPSSPAPCRHFTSLPPLPPHPTHLSPYKYIHYVLWCLCSVTDTQAPYKITTACLNSKNRKKILHKKNWSLESLSRSLFSICKSVGVIPSLDKPCVSLSDAETSY